MEPFKLRFIEPAFKDGKLNPLAEILERVSEPSASAVLPNIVGNDD